MATCAACLQPIPQGGKFRLSGTEVFHEACSHRIAHSEAARTKHLLLTVELRIRSLESEIELYKQSAGDMRRTTELTQKAHSQALSDLRVARRDVEMLKASLSRVQIDRDNLVREINLLRALNDEMQANRAPQTPAPAQPIPVTPEQPAKDDRDDAEIRFSLLELDPPL